MASMIIIIIAGSEKNILKTIPIIDNMSPTASTIPKIGRTSIPTKDSTAARINAIITIQNMAVNIHYTPFRFYI